MAFCLSWSLLNFSQNNGYQHSGIWCCLIWSTAIDYISILYHWHILVYRNGWSEMASFYLTHLRHRFRFKCALIRPCLRACVSARIPMNILHTRPQPSSKSTPSEFSILTLKHPHKFQLCAIYSNSDDSDSDGNASMHVCLSLSFIAVLRAKPLPFRWFKQMIIIDMQAVMQIRD